MSSQGNWQVGVPRAAVKPLSAEPPVGSPWAGQFDD
jgi:hypothetical protein